MTAFPVMVTYTHEHVVWVQADSQQAAVELMQSEPWGYTNDQETLANSDWKAEAPGQWDWEMVYNGDYFGVYRGLDYCAHVELFKGWLRKLDRAHAEATVENETRDGIAAEARRTCAACNDWREPEHEQSVHHRYSVRMAERKMAVTP